MLKQYSLIIILSIVALLGGYVYTHLDAINDSDDKKYSFFHFCAWFLVIFSIIFFMLNIERFRLTPMQIVPVVVTMMVMTIFENIFVKILDIGIVNAISDRSYSKINKFLEEKGVDPYDVYPKLLNMSLKFEPYENIMKENIGKLNNNNFAILYACLTILTIVNINNLSKYNYKTQLSTYYNVAISILSILYLFLFYYVNISSKANLEPQIDYKITNKLPEQKEKTMFNATDLLQDNYKAHSHSNIETPILNWKHNYIGGRNFYSKTPENIHKDMKFCVDACDANPDCFGIEVREIDDEKFGTFCEGLVTEINPNNWRSESDWPYWDEFKIYRKK